jgi:hypothetical protein
MPLIGDARTSQFFISAPEVRLGPMTSAMALKPEHSIGLLNSATVSFNVESVDLLGGVPRRIYDTQIISQLGTVSMDMREYSRRNMQFLLGYTPEAYSARVETTLAAAITAASDNDCTVASATGLSVDDLICVYPASTVDQANVTYTTIGAIAGAVLTCGPRALPFLFDYDIGDKVVSAQPVAIGAASNTQYFTAQVVGVDRRGNPIGFVFWKCALSSGLEVGFNADDFNTNSGEIKILSPSAADIATGGDLYDVRAEVARFPQGMAVFGGDIA